MATADFTRLKLDRPRVRAKYTVGPQWRYIIADKLPKHGAFIRPKDGGYGRRAANGALYLLAFVSNHDERLAAWKRFEPMVREAVKRGKWAEDYHRRGGRWSPDVKVYREHGAGFNVHPFIYRHLRRHFDMEVLLLGQMTAYIWDFATRVPEKEQYKVVRIAEARHEEQMKIDHEAAEALRMIGGAA